MKETKNQKFLRLMQARLERALEDFRLISQLASSNYRNTPEEAHEVIFILDRALHAVAKTFGITYRSWIQHPSSKLTIGPQLGPINEIDGAKAIALINEERYVEARKLLASAVNKEPR